MKINIGLIPIILRDEYKDGIWPVYERIAAIGFKAIEGGDLLLRNPGEAAANLKRFHDLGLRVVTHGTSKDALQKDVAKVIADAQMLGALHVTVFWGPVESQEQVLRDAAIYEEAGQKIAAAGFKLCYHNHDHEFTTKFAGRCAYDLLLDAAPHLYANVDVAWSSYGGTDPATYLTQRAGRVPVIHLKDFFDIKQRGSFTAVGTGLLNIQQVMTTAVQTGVQWAIVEQDRAHNLTPWESVTASYLNLKELGWV